MDFIFASHTDIGLKKNTNQDSYTCKLAKIGSQKVLFSVLCDGMGGLEKGEVASSHLIKAFCEWFNTDFSSLVETGRFEDIEYQWNSIIQNQNIVISEYSQKDGVQMGTTVVALLIYGNKYWFINVGDSRLYHIKKELNILTEDQTLVALEVKKGNLTPEQAEKDPRRSILLQCVGASRYIEPQYATGTIDKNEVMMLCSDGFRHKVSNEEIFNTFNPLVINSKEEIKAAEINMVELNKQRKETDNITVIVIKTI